MTSLSDPEKRILRDIQRRLAATYEVHESAIRGDTRFREDLDSDSLELLELLMELQEELGVIVTDDEARDLITVRDVVVLCARHLSPPAAPPARG